MGWITRKRRLATVETPVQPEDEKSKISKKALAVMEAQGVNPADVLPNAAGNITMKEVKAHIDSLATTETGDTDQPDAE